MQRIWLKNCLYVSGLSKVTGLQKGRNHKGTLGKYSTATEGWYLLNPVT
jgi:hypothetical protein